MEDEEKKNPSEKHEENAVKDELIVDDDEMSFTTEMDRAESVSDILDTVGELDKQEKQEKEEKTAEKKPEPLRRVRHAARFAAPAENPAKTSGENTNNNKKEEKETSGIGNGRYAADKRRSTAPFVRHGETVRSVMLDVIVALTPPIVWAVYVFGLRALTVILISVFSCVIFEAATDLLLHKNVGVTDLSAVVTGLLLAFTMPASVPFWMPPVGAFFAIVIVKQLFGGLGKNLVNPAAAASVFLFSSWNGYMTGFTKPYERLPMFSFSWTFGEVGAADPLIALRAGSFPQTSMLETFFGSGVGTIGTVSSVLLILGFIYLLFRKVITWHIPVAFAAAASVLTFLYPRTAVTSEMIALKYMGYHLCSGGLLLAAVFMATDPVTSPKTPTGKLIYGAGCGAITVLIRYFGAGYEGVYFAVLIMNLLTWYIDKLTKPKAAGGERIAKEK